MRLLILAIFISLFSLKSKAQQCECSLYETHIDQIDEATQFGNLEKMQTIIKLLNQDKNNYCRFLGQLSELKHKTKNHNFSTWETELKSIESKAKSLNCPKTEFFILHLKAEYFQEADQIENAINAAFELLKKSETANETLFALKAITIITSIYTRQDQDNKVMPYLTRFLQLTKTLKDERRFAYLFNYLARQYESLYAINEEKSKLDTFGIFANMALTYAKKFSLNGQIQYAYQNKEALAYHKGNFEESLRMHDSVYHFMKINHAHQQFPIYFVTKAQTLFELRRQKEAVLHQDSAIFYARKYSQPSYLANIIKQGVGIYEASGLFDKALISIKEYTSIKDSIQTTKRTEMINELELKYQKEKDEKTILKLSKQRSMLWSGLGILLLSIGLLYFIYRQKVMKRDQIILETEQRLNRARMNPHFFFNALASLQSFALNETDSMAIAENLSKFSHIMRETLENTYREYNTIQQEIDFLDEYLSLQQMRFPEKFEYNIINEVKEAESILIPSMIVQPFVENSVEHGFANIDYKGMILLMFSTDNKNTFIKIEDNGRGFNNQSPKSKPYISRASQIIKDRIYLLNLKLKSNAQFKIENNGLDKQGVKVDITLPIIHDY